jgi:glycosyltransferase involved in cell wall biosynthesis
MEQEKLFFSIIVPAHNEEKYIEETIVNLKSLNYPNNKFEAVIVENGSTDKTYQLAKAFETNNITVFSSTEKGVSKARNFGIKKINPESNWTVFLDADTILKTEFLNDLNTFLQKNSAKNYTVGTTALKPLPETPKAKRWFIFWDMCHRLFKVSYSIQIVKNSVLKNVKYDETLDMGEDIKIIKEARTFGKFFFLPTPNVFTSTRRFEEVGWWKLFFQWTIIANLPHFLQKKQDYKVTR